MMRRWTIRKVFTTALEPFVMNSFNAPRKIAVYSTAVASISKVPSIEQICAVLLVQLIMPACNAQSSTGQSLNQLGLSAESEKHPHVDQIRKDYEKFRDKSNKQMLERVQTARVCIAGHKVQLDSGVAFGATTRAPIAPREDARSYFTTDVSECAAGDLNADGKEDAAVIFHYRGRTSKGDPSFLDTWHLIALLTEKGQFKQVGDITLTHDANFNFESMTIGDGVVIVKRSVFNEKTASSSKVECKFKVVNGTLVCISPTPKELAVVGFSMKPTPLVGNSRDVVIDSAGTNAEAWPDIQMQKQVSMHLPPCNTVTKGVLNNARYVTMMEGDVKLTDGQFPPKPRVSNHKTAQVGRLIFTDGYDFKIQIHALCLGDLNGDGHNDGAVILSFPMGADGFGYELAPVVSDRGKLYQVGRVYLGRMIFADGVKIKNGVIIVKARIHGPDDWIGGPTEKVTWRFMVVKGQLIKLR